MKPPFHPREPTADEVMRYGVVAARVREAMKAMNLSASEFNVRVGVRRSDPTIYTIKAAKGPVTPLWRGRINKVLGIPMELLMNEEQKQIKARREAVALLTPVASAIDHGKPTPKQLLSLNLLSNGNARLTLDIELSIEEAMPLASILMDHMKQLRLVRE